MRNRRWIASAAAAAMLLSFAGSGSVYACAVCLFGGTDRIITCIDCFKDEYKVTSDFLAGSINTNPVIIRRILTQLKNAGLITVARGTDGIKPRKPPNRQCQWRRLPCRRPRRRRRHRENR